MKWKDLSLKERKQIYDSVRVNNPGATYFDIKQQFDSIPTYEDGKDESVAASFSLPEVTIYPQNRTGTPEYFERQRKISGAVNTVQPEAYITPAGYIKDAVNFIEDLGKGDYAGAAIDAALNLIPWGVGKGIKKLKSKVGRIVEGTEIDGASVHSFAPTQTKKKTKKKNVLPTDINDYNIILDNNIYMPGTANHELGHVADGLAGSRKIQDFDSGKEYITNTYLNYLANPNNAYSSAELRKMGLFDAAGSRAYLLNPTEAKSHMLTLNRSLKDSGKITNWSTPVDEKMILEYMRNPTSNKMVKNQYDLYRNKNEYIDRLNKLIPMEILMPLGGAGFAGYELNKE